MVGNVVTRDDAEAMTIAGIARTIQRWDDRRSREGAVAVNTPTQKPRSVIWDWGVLAGIEHAITIHELDHTDDKDESSADKRLHVKDVRTRTGDGVGT